MSSRNKGLKKIVLSLVVLSLALIISPVAYALTLVTTIDLDPANVKGDDPAEVGVHEVDNKIYVPAESSGDVSVINGATDTVITTIPDIAMAFGVGVNSNTDRAYVSSVDDNTVSIINTNTDINLAAFGVGANPRGVEVDEVLDKVLVANEGDDTASIFDAAAITVTPVPVGDGPFSVGIDYVFHKGYVTNKNDDTVSVIDLVADAVISAPIAVGDSPGGFAGGIGVNSITHKAYVCNANDGTISIIDTNTDTVIGVPIPVVTCAGITVNEATNRIKVAGFNVVNEIDGSTDTVIDTLAVVSNSRGVGVNPNTEKVYVANVGNDEVLVLSEAAVTQQVGGELLSIDSTALLLAGAQTPIAWMMYAFSAIGIGAFLFTRNQNNVKNVKVILQDYLDKFGKTN